MKIEHVAYQVADPVAVAAWYVKHLGMTVKRSQSAPPFAYFIADTGDTVMIEFYNNPAVPVPDYRAIDPVAMHLAFSADDVRADRQRLIAAGATSAAEPYTSDAGDDLAMLRDPWGLAVQLIHRRNPMLASR